MTYCPVETQDLLSLQATNPTNLSRFPRIGITVTKKVHKHAVCRNKIKRLIREVYRKNKHRLDSRFDFVIIAKSGADELTYTQVEKELFFMWQRTRLLDHIEKHQT